MSRADVDETSELVSDREGDGNGSRWDAAQGASNTEGSEAEVDIETPTATVEQVGAKKSERGATSPDAGTDLARAKTGVGDGVHAPTEEPGELSNDVGREKAEDNVGECRPATDGDPDELDVEFDITKGDVTSPHLSLFLCLSVFRCFSKTGIGRQSIFANIHPLF
jgi:hypothetical protein